MPQNIPRGQNGRELELVVLNAGEGAFHWVRCHHNSGCSGWIYDCGTRSGAEKLNASILAVTHSMKHPPALLIISHYHKDHISHIKKLAEIMRKKNLVPRKIWLPKIDPYSMSLYLRLLSFGSLFKNNSVILEDKHLNKLFAKRGILETDIYKWFPDIKVHYASRNDIDYCPKGNRHISVRALTPPDYEQESTHYLASDANLIRYTSKMKETSKVLRKTIDRLTENCDNNNNLFLDFLNREFPGEEFPSMRGLTENCLRIFSSKPNLESSINDNNILRSLLSMTLFARDSSVPRIPISGWRSPIPPPARKLLKNWKKKISDATHLFNIAVKITDSCNSSFLLTGDLDNRLWPLIIDDSDNTYTAIQIPHHGSEANVLFEAYEELNCSKYIVSAGKYSSWRHPSASLAATLGGSSKRETELYCTNDHENCEIRGDNLPCRDDSLAAPLAITISPTDTKFFADGKSRPAKKCPWL